MEITKHAIERFLTRCQRLGIPHPHDPNETIRKLLGRAIPEKVDPVHRVKRLINHKKEADYVIADGWRFVVSKDGQKLLTVERVRPEQN